jgi:hypothetical protein
VRTGSGSPIGRYLAVHAYSTQGSLPWYVSYPTVVKPRNVTYIMDRGRGGY